MKEESKSPAGCVRMGVSVPRQLRKQMQPYDVAVNWSAVFQNAIERKIAELKELERQGRKK